MNQVNIKGLRMFFKGFTGLLVVIICFCSSSFAKGQKYPLDFEGTIYASFSREHNNHIKVNNDAIISISGSKGDYEYEIEQGELIVKPLLEGNRSFEIMLYLDSGKSQHIKGRIEHAGEGQVISLYEDDKKKQKEFYIDSAVKFLSAVSKYKGRDEPQNLKAFFKGLAGRKLNLGQGVSIVSLSQFKDKDLTAYRFKLKNNDSKRILLKEQDIEIPFLKVFAASFKDNELLRGRSTELIVVGSEVE